MRAARQARGYDRDWFRLRALVLRLQPRCRVCGAKSQCVDHIETIRRSPDKRLKPSNFQALCYRCHNRLTNAYDRDNLKGAADEDGNPLDPRHPWSTGQVVDPADLKRDWVQRARR